MPAANQGWATGELFFLQLYQDIIDIKHCESLRCWFDTFILQNDYIALGNTSSTTHNYHFFKKLAQHFLGSTAAQFWGWSTPLLPHMIPNYKRLVNAIMLL